ncbi:MAG: HNH endonuclease [Geminicoccaceae bacterium]
MTKGVFVHRADSRYDDFPEERYQFPKTYLKQAQSFVDDWILYYEPRRGGGRLGYKAIAKAEAVEPDLSVPGMFTARIASNSFLGFQRFVSFRSKGEFLESSLGKADGSVNKGQAGRAVRAIPDAEFHRIVLQGFPEVADTLPRSDDMPGEQGGLSEQPQPFNLDDERSRVEHTISRIPRDRVFRRLVLDAYDCRCAVTGLKLINGGGRAEVEAAHIKPVAEHGPDKVTNGIALSGTVHWMFDRGLISLADDLEILVSRQINDAGSIRKLINASGRAFSPSRPEDRPHPVYLDWHRQHCFKV